MGGGSKYHGIIYLPPCPKIFKNSILQMESSSDNLASRHKAFTYHRHDYSVVYSSFFMRWRGGGSKYYCLIYIDPPPSKNIQEQYLYMESGDHLASTHIPFTYHRQDKSMVDISFLWDGGSIYYGIIY